MGKSPLYRRLTHVPNAALAILFVVFVSMAAHAQTYTILYTFNGVQDGNSPTSTLIFDRAGNLYGTTQAGGTYDQGLVFQMKHAGSGWIVNPLHEFHGNASGGDGAYPLDYGGLTIGPDGALYGTTQNGGIQGCNGDSSCGIVFRLQPPATACTRALCPWLESIVYEFNPQSGAQFPMSNVVFDGEGNLYGTAQYGNIFELSPSGGGWTQSDYDIGPYSLSAGLVLVNANLYGVTTYGGTNGYGTVFELSPAPSGWTETVLYNFTDGDDGRLPAGGVTFDSAGNLYGSTGSGGSGGGGTIFELSPSGGGWSLQTLCSFVGTFGGSGPRSSLTIDAAGNLYGTTYGDGPFGEGSVFKATRSGSSWTCADLFDFDGRIAEFPIGGVALDDKGNLYGTTSESETGGGVVWEITP